jgi:RNA polymerase sigma-70 factor (ECF subfamily)
VSSLELHPDSHGPATDSELAAQVAVGSAEALEVLYTRYGRLVLSFTTRMVGDRESGEELVQEVFVRVWRQAGAYSPERGTFVTWLLSIAHNLAIDMLRKRQRRPQRADAADPVLLLEQVADSSPSLEHYAELSHLRDRIGEALRILPDSQRRAIELAYVRGLTQREIAEETGDPLGTVKTRMRLGMQKLREHLEQQGVELP